MQFRPGNDMTRQRGVVIGPEAVEVLSFPNHSEEAKVKCFSIHNALNIKGNDMFKNMSVE